MTGQLAQISSTFIAPALALGGAAAMAIPVAIHLISRMRRRAQPWGAMRFVIEAYKQHKRRLLLEQWLLLTLRCLVVLVLGLALAGPLLDSSAQWWSSSGRVVHLLVDDSLRSGAVDTQGQTRFATWRKAALQIVDKLDDADRVVLWPSAFPGQADGQATFSAPIEARRAIENMQPRFSHPDLLVTLGNLAQALRQERVAPKRCFVVVLSDFSQSDKSLAQPVPDALADLGQLARVLVTRPGVSRANIAIESLQPQREMMFVVGGRNWVVPAQVRLRRYDEVARSAEASLQLSLRDSRGRELVSKSSTARWAVGQTVTTLNVDLPLPQQMPHQIAAQDGEDGQVLFLHGRVTPEQGDDALGGDNQFFAVVQLRQRLHVAVVDAAQGDGGQADSDFTPGRWLRLALSPFEQPDSGTIALQGLLPSQVENQTLLGFDAAMVLRPDLLGNRAWDELGRMARRGGVVWVFAPSGQTTAPWGPQLRRTFDLPWSIGMEVQTLGNRGASVGLGLNQGAAPPSGLRALAGDWQALLQPIRVYQHLPLSVPAGDRWLELAGLDQPDHATLLGVGQVGAGSLLLLAGALDSQWTNLPTKPLFVPLLHETLRSLLGGKASSIQRGGGVVVGQRPRLATQWLGGSVLEHVVGIDELALAKKPIALHVGDGNIEVARTLEMPGIYRSDNAVAMLLAVNVQPGATDCRAVSEQRLAAWLEGLGPWNFLDMTDPQTFLKATGAAGDVGWSMLWLGLVLLLIETVLARWISHARVVSKGTWTDRLLGSLEKLRQPGKKPGEKQ